MRMRAAAGLYVREDARVIEIADVDHAHAAEALRTGVLAHALRATIDTSISRLAREKEQVLVDGHVILLLRARLRGHKGRARGVGHVPDREPLEVALNDVMPCECQVRVHVVEVARRCGNELWGRPARRDQAQVPCGLGGIPQAGAEADARIGRWSILSV